MNTYTVDEELDIRDCYIYLKGSRTIYITEICELPRHGDVQIKLKVVDYDENGEASIFRSPIGVCIYAKYYKQSRNLTCNMHIVKVVRKTRFITPLSRLMNEVYLKEIDNG